MSGRLGGVTTTKPPILSIDPVKQRLALDLCVPANHSGRVSDLLALVGSAKWLVGSPARSVTDVGSHPYRFGLIFIVSARNEIEDPFRY